MAKRSARKQGKACGCGYLQQAAADPDLPIEFDEVTGEFQFVYPQPAYSEPATIRIYYCPICGGAAPSSKLRLLFAVVPDAEEERLAKVLRPVRTIRSALRRLGKPDVDDPSGSRSEMFESEGRPPVWQHQRTLVYERLSDVADVHIVERPDGGVFWELRGKYVGEPR